MEEDRKRLERTMAARNFRQGMEVKDQQNRLERTMAARNFRQGMEVRDQNPGIPNMGGFDPGDLMAAPKLRQDATMNQANMVSSPYFEANEKAAEKTNPMNAASQEPGKLFLMKFIGK
jgi:hypothetical protein